ncbi:MAG: SufS family cysteine desulfurase [Bacteroidia bacterium]|nr:MAG: SufS family cysteine desulfurase [Bacteroidia bacterium]
MGFNIEQIRKDFPILQQQVYNKPLIYLDNGATTHKPQVVIDTLRTIYEKQNSSIHRAIHYLSEQMTSRYESARETVRSFINAASIREIIFTSGATGSINAVAFSFGEKYVAAGDEILISEMEHHSNIVPWQMMCERKGAQLKVIPFDEKGELQLDQLDELLSHKTRIVALTHASNSLGTINPVKEVIRRAHEREIPVLLDGAQMVQHGAVDVRELDCDFYVFSSHKIFGPTGSGVLYGKEALLEEMPPYQGGGDMVDQVSFEGTTYNTLPFKFEAGTSHYTGAIGLAAALDYIRSVGIEEIGRYEQELIRYTREKLEGIEQLKIYGESEKRISVFSFLLDNIHTYDAGMILDKMGIAVRTGTHCTQPVMDHFGISGTIRASLVFYNTMEEVDRLVEGIRTTIQMLS